MSNGSGVQVESAAVSLFLTYKRHNDSTLNDQNFPQSMYIVYGYRSISQLHWLVIVDRFFIRSIYLNCRLCAMCCSYSLRLG